jgi:hypothetical protein
LLAPSNPRDGRQPQGGKFSGVAGGEEGLDDTNVASRNLIRLIGLFLFPSSITKY